MNVLNHVKDLLQGKVPLNKKRSDKWPAIRKAFLEKSPLCAVCDSSKKIEVHHVKPFHEFPELELSPDNLITLCEGDTSCHLLYGHLKNFKSINVNVREDAQTWNHKIRYRP